MSAKRGMAIALDVGGSSVKSGVVRAGGQVSYRGYAKLDATGPAETIVAALQVAIERQLRRVDRKQLRGIGFGFPGPFDYANGVCYIPSGQHKYEAIYGLDLRAALRARLGMADIPIVFRNDAEAAIVGEGRYGTGRGYARLLGITLGTGLGAAFLADGVPVRAGERVPPNGELYAEPFHGAMADDTFSSRGLRARLRALDPAAGDVAAAAAAAAGDARLRAGFAAFGADLGAFLEPYVRRFGAEAVLVLGGIARALELFQDSLAAALTVPAVAGALGTDAALLGAAEPLLEG